MYASQRQIPERCWTMLICASFLQVLLYNFFADSPATKEWDVLRNFLDVESDREKRRREGTYFGTFGRVEEEDETLEELLCNKTEKLKRLAQAVEFDQEKHKLLESELKYLYTAITRSRVNVWFYDSSNHREPFFALCRKRGLVNIVHSMEESTGLFAKSTTAKAWLARGNDFVIRAKEEMDDLNTRRGRSTLHLMEVSM